MREIRTFFVINEDEGKLGVGWFSLDFENFGTMTFPIVFDNYFGFFLPYFVYEWLASPRIWESPPDFCTER